MTATIMYSISIQWNNVVHKGIPYKFYHGHDECIAGVSALCDDFKPRGKKNCACDTCTFVQANIPFKQREDDRSRGCFLSSPR
ncbi:hypothetical protein MTR_2g105040 [Medicago truncatula]|uniref:Uncharacterized protein n=1 Tax=Medicago truncatula TaxID=3880 RepID=A0A072VDV9_MEDTR|nr:hypothetical protein MTR_2g105040 [Medicago truncatula]